MTDLNEIYKSVLDSDNAAVVICDLEHIIIYMNPTAIVRYEKWGGYSKYIDECPAVCRAFSFQTIKFQITNY